MPKLIDTTLFSDGLNGPVGMSDAALSLWSTVIESRSVGGLSAPPLIVTRLVNWLSSYYTLSLSPHLLALSPVDWMAVPGIDREFSKQMALYATPAAILRLLLLCTNSRTKFYETGGVAISSPVFIAAYHMEQNAGLSRYLIQAQAPLKPRAEASPDVYKFNGDPRARDTSNDHVVIEMLLLKLQNFREAWIALSKERASNISADIIQIMTSLIVLSAVLPTLLGKGPSQICKDLVHSARQAWTILYRFIELTGDVRSNHAFVAAATVTAIRGSKLIVAEDPVLQALSFMLSDLLFQLNRGNLMAAERQKDDMDILDAGDTFVSHSTQSSSYQLSLLGTREDLPFATNQYTFNRAVLLLAHISWSAAESAKLTEEHGVPSTMDYLVDLRPEELLASCSSISVFLRSSNLSGSDACRLLKRVARACIQDYDFERCEASLCLCLEVMTILAELWVADADDELHEVASDMYEWFIKVPLGKDLASARVLIKLALLLETVLNLDLSYNNTSLPSSRTSLFEILRKGSNVVKFHVAEKVSRIFDRFILPEHTAILNDVVESLPNESTDLDGIALRLYVLAELAARWPTLLRSSVYHMFETSAHVPLCGPHAKNCLLKISSNLGLDSPRDMFVLFAPQLLYTWLEVESLESVPFSVYGFSSLPELLAAVQDEVVGQIVMRANEGLANKFSQIMETPFDTMLQTSFPKSEAYSVARDISMPPSKDNASKSTESQVRKQLGTERYLRLVSLSFPQIVTHLFLSLSNEQEIERALARRSEFALAAAILQKICHRSASKIVLPPGQQPSFRAKYLLDELEFLCQRIGKDQFTMWTSPLVIFVCRNLLDSVVPALGPLHACSMLRKLRIVVALAGPAALQGYALEMLLQALQPYLAKFYCAEDALGLFWYILDEGRGYLQHKLPFLCGLALKTLLSLSAFLAAPQDMTTQESHYLSTLSIAASFHKWFGEYLATIPDQPHTADDDVVFKKLVHHAKEVRPPGRADKDSVEGKLLLELFEARTSEQKILSPGAFRMAVQILCRSFSRPTKPEDDILGTDSLATRHAKVLWGLLEDLNAESDFWTWAGEALGRAYAANGVVDLKLTMEHSHGVFLSSDPESGSARTSRSLIVGNLRDLLYGDDYTAASLAEKTLQQIITQVAHQQALDEYEDSLDHALSRSLNWYPVLYPDMSPFKRYSLTTEGHVGSIPQIPAANWAAQFMVALASSVKEDPLLGALPPILSRISDLAPRIMPYVVHSFLHSDNRDGQPHRQIVSQAFQKILVEHSSALTRQRKLVLGTLLYLRCQPMRKESTIADRSSWLSIDFGTAAAAAVSSAMYKSALLFFELHASQQVTQSSRSSRRSSAVRGKESAELMRQIYQGLDDPDFFYGIQEEASLTSVMRKVNHEGDKFKSLSFQSALLDSGIRTSDIDDQFGLLKALVSANMNGVAAAVQAQWKPETEQRKESSVSASLTALNLHQWNLPVSVTASDPPSLLFQVFRAANTAHDFAEVSGRLEGSLSTLVKSITQERAVGSVLRHSMSALAALTETREALSSRSSEELAAFWLKLVERAEWQETAK